MNETDAVSAGRKDPVPDFIPGIYNYCDHWCERCAQKGHCISYAMTRRLEEKGGLKYDAGEDAVDHGAWSRFKHVFESSYEVLHELADERGVKVEEIYERENISREFWGVDFENADLTEREMALTGNSVLIRLYLIYESLAMECLDKVFKRIDSGFSPDDRTLDRLEMLNWYFELIPGKLKKALTLAYRAFMEGKTDDSCLGPAKIVLIAVDRSLEAWQNLQDCLPDMSAKMEELKTLLVELEGDLTFQFPGAADFQRPGFERPER